MSLRSTIATDLRRLISSGQLKPGQYLPTEKELAATHQASPGTVKRATAELVIAGLIERVPGRNGGMRVREHVVITHFASRAELPDSPFSESDTFFREVQEQGFTPSQEFSVHIEELTPEQAQILEVDEGTTAAVRRCLRMVNALPHSIQETFYPRWLTDLVEELMSPRDIPEGTTQLLKARGFEQIAMIDTEVSRMPTPEETTSLALKGVTSVLEWARTGYTASRPVRLTYHVMAGPASQVMYALGDPAALKRALELRQ